MKEMFTMWNKLSWWNVQYCLISVRCSCSLKFGTWSNDVSKLNITLIRDYMDANFTDFLHGEWDVQHCPCKTFIQSYHDTHWPVFECHLIMQRKALFYVFNLGVPIVLLLFIGGLVFFLPPDSGDKIALSITVFLALTVFIMVIMENLPSTSQAVPLLGRYHFCAMSSVHYWHNHNKKEPYATIFKLKVT